MIYVHLNPSVLHSMLPMVSFGFLDHTGTVTLYEPLSYVLMSHIYVRDSANVGSPLILFCVAQAQISLMYLPTQDTQKS